MNTDRPLDDGRPGLVTLDTGTDIVIDPPEPDRRERTNCPTCGKPR